MIKHLGRVVRWAALAFCVAFIAIQLVPVSRTNPPVQGDFNGSPEVASVLQRACYDCHSNETVWPWYSRIAPISWLIAHDVNEGRAELNFSAWNQLSAGQQAKAIRESWKEIAEGEMPTWYYVILHPEARLSEKDRSVLQAWAASSGARERGNAKSKDDDD